MIGKADRLRRGEYETASWLVLGGLSSIGSTSSPESFARDRLAEDAVTRLSSEVQAGPLAGLIGKADRESKAAEYDSKNASPAVAVFAAS